MDPENIPTSLVEEVAQVSLLFDMRPDGICNLLRDFD
jgi:hypothetical protein